MESACCRLNPLRSDLACFRPARENSRASLPENHRCNAAATPATALSERRKPSGPARLWNHLCRRTRTPRLPPPLAWPHARVRPEKPPSWKANSDTELYSVAPDQWRPARIAAQPAAFLPLQSERFPAPAARLNVGA